jgi:DNA-binding transcriptional ArsR family regulator
MADSREDHTLVMEEDADFLEELSEYLNVLSNATRLKILKSIERRPKDVREISSEIKTSYENTKKHLDKLLMTGVIKKEAGMSRPTAKGVHPVWKYSLVPGGLEGIIRTLGLFSNVNVSIAHPDLSRRLEEVRGMIAEEVCGALPVLVLLGGPDDGLVFPLQGERVLIGRTDPNTENLPPADDYLTLGEEYGAVTRISKPHARLTRIDGAWQIEDCGSTGGTSINGAPIAPHARTTLSDGDLIDLARGVKGARLVFTLSDEKASKER